MEVQAFIPSSENGKASGSLRLQPPWSTEQFSEQSALISERQKGGEDVIKQGGHGPVTECSRTLHVGAHVKI